MVPGQRAPRCPVGHMELAPAFAERIRTWIEHPKAREGNALNLSPGCRYGGRWFCPADGSTTHEAEVHVRCVKCNGPLDGFMWKLLRSIPTLPTGVGNDGLHTRLADSLF